MAGPFLYSSSYDLQQLIYKTGNRQNFFSLIIGAPVSGKTTVLEYIADQMTDRGVKFTKWTSDQLIELVNSSNPAAMTTLEQVQKVPSTASDYEVIIIDNIHTLFDNNRYIEKLDWKLRDWVENENKCIVCSTLEEAKIKYALRNSTLLNNFVPVVLYPTEFVSLYESRCIDSTATLIAKSQDKASARKEAARIVTASGGHPALLAVYCDLVIQSAARESAHAIDSSSHQSEEAAFEARYVKVVTERALKSIWEWLKKQSRPGWFEPVLRRAIEAGSFGEEANRTAKLREALCRSGLALIQQDKLGGYEPTSIKSNVIRNLLEEMLDEEGLSIEQTGTSAPQSLTSQPDVSQHNNAGRRIEWSEFGDKWKWGLATIIESATGERKEVKFGERDWKIIQVMRSRPNQILPLIAIWEFLKGDGEFSGNQGKGVPAVRSALARLISRLKNGGLDGILMNIRGRGYVWSEEPTRAGSST